MNEEATLVMVKSTMEVLGLKADGNKPALFLALLRTVAANEMAEAVTELSGKFRDALRAATP